MNPDENRPSISRRLLEHLSVATELARQLVVRDESLEAPPDVGASPSTGSAAPGGVPLLPGPGPAGVEEEAHRRILHQRVAADVRENEYKTNDLVELTGGIGTAEKHLKINGTPTIHLTKPEFVLFLILAAHARSLEGLSSPRRTVGGKYLGVDELLRAIDTWGEEDSRLKGFWANATFSEVHRTVCEIRRKIRKVGANPNIIQTGPKGEGGYRLSTSAYNITITLR